MRLAAKIDDNQPDIIRALRQIGVAVEIIGRPVDLLLWHRGEYSLMEVKALNGGRFTKAQVEFMARWPGKVHVVRTVEEAIAAVIGRAALQ